MPDDPMVSAIEETKAHIGQAREVEMTLRDGIKRKEVIRTVRIIGRGVFGLVSEIQMEKTNNRAVKMVYQKAHEESRELNILLGITHQNITQLHGFYTMHHSVHGYFLNMVLDYMPVCLADYITANKGMAIETARSLMRQMLEALCYLHGCGIAHRDIKPSNIVLDNERRLKLCDLGSAKVLNSEVYNSANICPRYYRPPENLLGYRNYSVKVDIWSAGAVFCEFGMPGPIFKHSSVKKTLRAIVKLVGDPTDFTGIHDSCFNLFKKPTNAPGIASLVSKHFKSTELVDVLAQMLVVDPSMRLDAATLLKMPFFR